MKEKACLVGVIGGVLFLFTGFTSCQTPHVNHAKLQKTARECYVRRDYDAAVMNVAKSLRMKPDYRKSQELIQEVLPKAVDSHLERIKQAQSSSDKFKWDTVVSEYSKLIDINQEVKSLPTLMDKKTKQPIRLDVRDYATELAEAKTSAAEDHYLEGKRWFGREGMANRDRAAEEFRSANSFIPNYKDGSTLAAEGYYQEGLLLAARDGGVGLMKEAAKAFSAALECVQDYKDAATRYERCRQAGITRIAIVPFQNKSGKGNQYGAVADMIVDGIVSDIMNDPSATEFLEVVSRSQLEQILAEARLGMEGIIDVESAAKAGNVLAVHQIITGQITQLSITPERTTDKRVQERAQTQVGRERYVDKKGRLQERPVWGDVVANVTVHTRTAGASISGSCAVIEVGTARIKNSHQLSGTYRFEDTWATFSGDERALSNGSKALMSKSESRPPVESEMVNMAVQDLTSSLSYKLKEAVR